jgi:hypothetical protein
LANFDVTSFACYLGLLSTAAAHVEKAIKLPGAFHHRRILPQPCETDARTSNPTAGDHQRVNAENKNDADEDEGDA